MSTWGRWRRWLSAIVVVVLVLLGAAPSLLTTAAGKRFLLSRLSGRVNGSIEAGDLTLGWFHGPAVQELEIRTPDGRPAVRVARLRMETPLWRLALGPSDLGTIRIEQPRVSIVTGEQGTNLATLFPSPPQPQAGAPPAAPTCRLEIVDASLSWLPKRAEHEWGLDHVHAVLGVRPGPPGNPRAECFLQPAVIADHATLTHGMCDDVLKYIAVPIFQHISVAASDAARLSGQVSLTLDDGRWPLGDIAQASLGGQLSLHAVEVGPGRLVRDIAAVFRLPDYSIQLAREAHIKFAMNQGRVRHEGLEFGIGNVLKVTTSGTVALADQALDLVALVRVHVPTSPAHDQPFLRALNEQEIRLPIRGTLKQPAIDASALPAAGLALLQAALARVQQGRPLGTADELLQTLREQGIVPKPPEGSPRAVDVPATALQILGGLLQRRRERSPQPSDANPPPVPENKRPLGRLLDRLRPAGQEKPPPAPATEPPRTPPSNPSSSAPPSQRQ